MCQRRLGRSIQTQQIQPDSCRRLNRARKSKLSFPKLSKLGTILFRSVLHWFLLQRFSDSFTPRGSAVMDVVLKSRNELTALPLSIKNEQLYLLIQTEGGDWSEPARINEDTVRWMLWHSEDRKDLSTCCHIKSADVFRQR